MTPQEKQLLERFLADMVAARAGPKDPEAEALMREAVSRQPDAVYLLVQRAIQLDQAVQLTQAEVQKLQNELAQAKAAATAGGSGGFLSDPYAWGARPAGAPAAAAPQQQVAQPTTMAQAQSPAPAPARPLSGGWGGGSGMLGTVAGVAAGAVGGALLFQGIQSLMHHNDTPAQTHGIADSQAAAHPVVGDSTGFEDVVPDDSDLLASGDDDGNVT